MSETKENLVFRSFDFDESARTLLENQGLPVSDLPEEHTTFYELLHENDRVALGAIQFLGETGLLRSVLVEPDVRNCGYGTELVMRLIDVARTGMIQELYLLTRTARRFFEEFGFRALDRDRAPSVIQSTEEFDNLCSSGTVLMVKGWQEEE